MLLPLMWQGRTVSADQQHQGLLRTAKHHAMALTLRAALRTVERLSSRHHIALDYRPTSANRPRYGHGKPEHQRVKEILASRDADYRRVLEDLSQYEGDLVAIARDSHEPTEPQWLNEWLPGLDGAALYGFVRSREPRNYVEIGSGMSTKFVHRAMRDGELTTRLTSIDPHPRAEIDQLCDELIRLPLEEVDVSLFTRLTPGDVIFFDGSHRVFMNSDATVFFLEVIPALASGVLVGIHDILLPADYWPEWSYRYYSEQYLLAAYLLGGSKYIAPVLPCYYASRHAELKQILAPMWRQSHFAGVDPSGSSFWFVQSDGAS